MSIAGERPAGRAKARRGRARPGALSDDGAPPDAGQDGPAAALILEGLRRRGLAARPGAPAGEGPSASQRPAAVRPAALVVPHLAAFIVASLLVAAALAGGDLYARWTVGRSIHALAPDEFFLKTLGSIVQAEAFRQPDLLPLYGSSDLVRALPITAGPEVYSFDGPYTAGEFFRTSPTGFQVFTLGRFGATPLVILQDLAAIGPELRGKRLAIWLSPTWLLETDVDHPTAYENSFAPLHAGKLAFEGDLSFSVKQAAARRMLTFPRTLAANPLLAFGLERLAGDSLLDRALYYAVLPLGRLQNLVLELQDRWEALAYIRSRPDVSPSVLRQEARPDWPPVLKRAEQEAKARDDNNPFGFDNRIWERRSGSLSARRNSRTDAGFARTVPYAPGAADLDLLLQGLRDLGARPLIVSMPLKGPYFTYLGVSAGGRQVYYERLRALIEPYGVPYLDFADHDEDRYFVVDPSSHPSQKAWAYVDRALDDFFHDRLR